MKYNYFYCGTPIAKSTFIHNVPENWEDEVNDIGHYSYGYYSADLVN